LAYILNKKIVINADSLSQLENMGKFYTKSQARKLSACAGIRINSMVGAGHHKKVTTGGRDSIFGIHYKDVGGVKKIAQKYNLKIVGLHQHIGSGILKVQDYLRASDVLLQLTEQFDELQYIDFGGGLGVPYESSQKPLNIKELGAKLSEKFTYFAKEKKIELRLEPGRFLVAQAGTLLIEVTALKKTPAGEFVAGTNSGMTHLIRPALYGSYHEVVNISNSEGRRAKTTVKGNVCETSDIFAKNRLISQPREGDLLAIRDTGAYGMAMASRFNGRLLPAEILIDKDAERIIRRRDTFGDFLPK
jgi:diaminopimelate decarboxylase